jgi:hypothetical protein
MTTSPIACTLSPADYAERVGQLADLGGRALRSRVPLPDGVRLRFDPGATSADELRAVVAAERECCPFLRLEVREDADVLELDIAGPPTRNR